MYTGITRAAKELTLVLGGGWAGGGDSGQARTLTSGRGCAGRFAQGRLYRREKHAHLSRIRLQRQDKARNVYVLFQALADVADRHATGHLAPAIALVSDDDWQISKVYAERAKAAIKHIASMIEGRQVADDDPKLALYDLLAERAPEPPRKTRPPS